MDLSPFYRWTGALPKKPGEMLRQEPQPAQPEITHAALAQAHPLQLDGSALEGGHRAGQRHLLPAQGRSAGRRLAAGRLGAWHAGRGRCVRAVVGRPPAARRHLDRPLAGERLCRGHDRLPGARRPGPASVSDLGGGGPVGARQRAGGACRLPRQARGEGLHHRPVAGLRRGAGRHPDRAELRAGRAPAGDGGHRRRPELSRTAPTSRRRRRSARRTTSRC